MPATKGGASSDRDIELHTPPAGAAAERIEVGSERAKNALQHPERRPGALGRDSSELPKGYYLTPRFLGTYTVHHSRHMCFGSIVNSS